MNYSLVEVYFSPLRAFERSSCAYNCTFIVARQEKSEQIFSNNKRQAAFLNFRETLTVKWIQSCWISVMLQCCNCAWYGNSEEKRFLSHSWCLCELGKSFSRNVTREKSIKVESFFFPRLRRFWPFWGWIQRRIKKIRKLCFAFHIFIVVY